MLGGVAVESETSDALKSRHFTSAHARVLLYNRQSLHLFPAEVGGARISPKDVATSEKEMPARRRIAGSPTRGCDGLEREVERANGVSTPLF